MTAEPREPWWNYCHTDLGSTTDTSLTFDIEDKLFFFNFDRIWSNRVHILLYGFLKVNLRPPSAAVSTSFAKFAIFATYAALKAATQSICRQLCLSAGSWWCIRRALTCLEKRINRVMKCKMTFIHACADFNPEIFTGMEAQIGKKHSKNWKTALFWFKCQVGWSGSQVMWLGQVVSFGQVAR